MPADHAPIHAGERCLLQALRLLVAYPEWVDQRQVRWRTRGLVPLAEFAKQNVGNGVPGTRAPDSDSGSVPYSADSLVGGLQRLHRVMIRMSHGTGVSTGSIPLGRNESEAVAEATCAAPDLSQPSLFEHLQEPHR